MNRKLANHHKGRVFRRREINSNELLIRLRNLRRICTQEQQQQQLSIFIIKHPGVVASLVRIRSTERRNEKKIKIEVYHHLQIKSRHIYVKICKDQSTLDDSCICGGGDYLLTELAVCVAKEWMGGVV